jgi:hypothetical protein
VSTKHSASHHKPTLQYLMHKARFVLDKTKPMTPERKRLVEEIVSYAEEKKEAA